MGLGFTFGNTINASDVDKFPDLSDVLNGWTKRITLVKITQTVVNQDTVNTEEEISFVGTVQPLRPEEIKYDPQGQRSWEWLQIHSYSGSLNLKTTDRIVFNTTKYKLMAELDYSLNGYVEYHLIKDYQ